MTPKKAAPKLPKIPVIPLALALFLLAIYVFFVLVPAFSKADGAPADIASLIGQPVLIVGGLIALIWGRSWFDKNNAEKK
ncbi:MAG: hypothetical protein WA792_05750 [Pseudolabrys sp.]